MPQRTQRRAPELPAVQILRRRKARARLRRRRRTEHSLKNSIAPCGKRSKIIGASYQRIKSSYKRSCPRKHKPESYQPVTGSADTEIHHILHQNIPRILRPRKSRLTKSKSCLHKKTRIAATRTHITSVAEYITSPPLSLPIQKKCIPESFSQACTSLYRFRYFYGKSKGALESDPKRPCFYAWYFTLIKSICQGQVKILLNNLLLCEVNIHKNFQPGSLFHPFIFLCNVQHMVAHSLEICQDL